MKGEMQPENVFELISRSMCDTGERSARQEYVIEILFSVMKRYGASEIDKRNLKDLQTLERMLDITLSPRYEESAAIRDILEGNVTKQFRTGNTYGHARRGPDTFRYHVQDVSVSELFDYDSLSQCCAFHSGNERKSSSTAESAWKRGLAALFASDPSTALVFLRNDKHLYCEPVGVSINFFAVGPNGEKILAVGGVEGNRANMPPTWYSDFFDVTVRFAADNGCDYVYFGRAPKNKTPRKFKSLLKRHIIPNQKGFSEVNHEIRKLGGYDHISKYGASHILFETFAEHGKKPIDRYKAWAYEVPKSIK